MMMTAEKFFVDTNILLAATDTGRRDHALASSVFTRAAARGIHPFICGQVVREYLVVATRSVDSNGLGLVLRDALHNVRQFRRRCGFLAEDERTAEILLSLAEKHRITGKRIHDANLVALMQAHGIRTLLTLNPRDFACFEGITIPDLAEFENGGG